MSREEERYEGDGEALAAEDDAARAEGGDEQAAARLEGMGTAAGAGGARVEDARARARQGPQGQEARERQGREAEADARSERGREDQEQSRAARRAQDDGGKDAQSAKDRVDRARGDGAAPQTSRVGQVMLDHQKKMMQGGRPDSALGHAANTAGLAAKTAVAGAGDYAASKSGMGVAGAAKSMAGDAGTSAVGAALMLASPKGIGFAVGAVMAVGMVGAAVAGGAPVLAVVGGAMALRFGARLAVRAGVKLCARLARHQAKNAPNSRLGKMAKGLGKSLKGFEDGMKGADRLIGGPMNTIESAIGGGVKALRAGKGLQGALQAGARSAGREVGRTRKAWSAPFKWTKGKVVTGAEGVAKGGAMAKDAVAGTTQKARQYQQEYTRITGQRRWVRTEIGRMGTAMRRRATRHHAWKATKAVGRWGYRGGRIGVQAGLAVAGTGLNVMARAASAGMVGVGAGPMQGATVGAGTAQLRRETMQGAKGLGRSVGQKWKQFEPSRARGQEAPEPARTKRRTRGKSGGMER